MSLPLLYVHTCIYIYTHAKALLIAFFFFLTNLSQGFGKATSHGYKAEGAPFPGWLATHPHPKQQLSSSPVCCFSKCDFTIIVVVVNQFFTASV